MGKIIELQKLFEEKLSVSDLLKRVEESPDKVKDTLQKLKAENREPLIAAAFAFFSGEGGDIDQKTRDLITNEVDTYLEEIARHTEEHVKQKDWQERAKKRLLSFNDFVRVHKSTFIFVTIVTVIIVGIAFIISSVGQNTNVSKPQAKAVTSLAQGQITVRQKGMREATITVEAPLAASEILLYENSKVIGHWDRGGILKKTVFHQEGAYIYFAEIFLGSGKSITDQKSVTYGGEEK
ncbi:MAG: hypothetical protein WC650_05755 [Candidatus Doudnabacteria bacterium]